MMTNTSMRRRTPTLVLVDGGNDVARIYGSNAIFDFLVARARAREMAEAIDSVVRYGGAMWSVSMRDIDDGLSSLDASLAP